MVNLSEEEKREWTDVLVEAMLEYVYTPATLKEIEQSNAIEAARTKEENEQDRQVNERLNGKKGHESLVALYDEFERRNLEYIEELSRDIGLMAKLKERCNGGRIYDYCRYFINLYGCEIEELYGEIEEYREFAKGLKELPG